MATIYDIMNSNTGRMTQKMGGTPISTPTMNPTNINYGTVLTSAQAGITPTTSKKTKTTVKKEEKVISVPKKEMNLQEKFNQWFSTNKAGYGNLFKKITGQEAIKYNIPGSPTFKKVNTENEKKYLQGLYTTGNQGQKDFAKTQAAIYGFSLEEPSVDVAKENPTMAGVFADYVKKSGVGVKPLVTPIDTIPASVPVVPSTITTPGLEPTSAALIEAQGAIKPEVKPVKVDVTEGKPAEEKADEITGGKKDITKNESDKIKTDLDNQEAEALDKATTPEQKNNIMQYFNKLQNEITRRTISQLKAGKEQALIALGQQQAAIVPQYEAQRARAATQSMQQARNFGEYMAARGQTTSGLAAQAELTRGAGLTRQLGEIGQQQQAAQDQLNANKAKIQSDFQLAIANAKSDAEIAKLNQAFQQAIKAEDRAYNEKITADNRAYAEELLKDDRAYNEMIFNRNRALELGDIADARKYEKQMIDYRAGIELNLAEQKAALAPLKPTEYNYATDPDFEEVYNQIISGEILEYKRQADVGFPNRRVVVKKDPKTVYDSIVADRINLTNAFGEEGYKILVDTAKNLIPKETTTSAIMTQLNAGQTNTNQ